MMKPTCGPFPWGNDELIAPGDQVREMADSLLNGPMLVFDRCQSLALDQGIAADGNKYQFIAHAPHNLFPAFLKVYERQRSVKGGATHQIDLPGFFVGGMCF